MKLNLIKTLLLTILLFSAGTIIAQPPPAIATQAIAKDPRGNVAANRQVYVQVTIYQTSPITGVVVWKESHVVTSNDDGIYTFFVGRGTKDAAVTMPLTLGLLDWANGPFFVNYKTAVAPSIPAPWWLPADNYVDGGTTQYFSVPYALFSGNASVTNVNASIQPGPPNTFLITDSLGNVNWQTPQAAQTTVTTITNVSLNLKVTAGQDLVIDPNTTTTVYIDVSGVDVGDPILVTPQGDYIGWAIYSQWVTKTGQVAIRFANYTDEPVKVTGSQYKVVVVKY